MYFFLVWNPQASAPMTSGTHTDGGAVTRKPGSAWLEGTPAMDLGNMNVVLKWMHLYVEIECRNCKYLQYYYYYCVFFCCVLCFSVCGLVLFCVLSVYYLFVICLGCGLWFEVMYLFVGSGCRDRNYLYNY